MGHVQLGAFYCAFFLTCTLSQIPGIGICGHYGAFFVACTSSQLTRAARILPIGYSHNAVDAYDVDDFFFNGRCLCLTAPRLTSHLYVHVAYGGTSGVAARFLLGPISLPALPQRITVA